MVQERGSALELTMSTKNIRKQHFKRVKHLLDPRKVTLRRIISKRKSKIKSFENKFRTNLTELWATNESREISGNNGYNEIKPNVCCIHGQLVPVSSLKQFRNCFGNPEKKHEIRKCSKTNNRGFWAKNESAQSENHQATRYDRIIEKREPKAHDDHLWW